MRSRREPELTRSPHDTAAVAPLQAVKVDAESGRACGLFANISHEIRTPMNGLLGALSLMQDTELSNEQRALVTMAHNSAEDLFALTSNILDLAMIEAGTFSLKQLPFDARAELEQVVTLQAALAEARGIDLTARYPAFIPELIGDAPRWRQIATILIGAAIDRSHQGRLLLELDAALTFDRRCNLSLSLRNVDAAPSDRAAEAVGSVSASRPTAAHPYAKSDLEWALCAGLARLAGGEISAIDQAGGTSRISVTLNLACAPSPLTGVRLLFIEPQPTRRQELEQKFALHAARATGCSNADELLRALKHAADEGDPCSIVILDQQMHGIDGETLGAAIKSDAAYCATRLVLLTSSPPEATAGFAQRGFAAALSKPVADESLIDALKTLCNRGNQPPRFITSADVAATPPAREQVQPFEGYRVLVADDNVVNQQIALRMLAKLGCLADAAINGRQAVAMHRAGSYDLVLMDCQMPELDGYQATAQIRNSEAGARHTPIIAWTAHAMPGEQEKCMRAGMDDFMSKPLRPPVLRTMLDRWLLHAAPPLAQAAGLGDELDAIQEMFGSDFIELAGLFQADSPGRIAALYDAAAKADASGMASVAHALSGSTASIGATGLAALCKEIETRAKAGRLDDLAPRLAAIEAEYARIETRLAAMIATSNA